LTRTNALAYICSASVSKGDSFVTLKMNGGSHIYFDHGTFESERQIAEQKRRQQLRFEPRSPLRPTNISEVLSAKMLAEAMEQTPMQENNCLELSQMST
jgi:hypothetical protein